MKHRTQGGYMVVVGAGVVLLFSTLYFGAPHMMRVTYNGNVEIDATQEEASTTPPVPEEPVFIATHLDTPQPLKAIYMTSWVAGTPHIREKIISLIEETELNAVVIDIKDDTGKISFDVWDTDLEALGGEDIRIGDLRALIQVLHQKGIYVIGRIAVFQDPHLVTVWPEDAVKDTTGEIWRDRKGIAWMDASSQKVWDYAIAIGKEAYDAGFDELNYDYIRFPSDGDMYDIMYPLSEEKINADPNNAKALIIESFFKYLSNAFSDHGAVLSADLFGMVTTNANDLNIGQKLEFALPYFDYIAPMVYPSHYPTGFIGLGNPSEHPYEVIDYSLETANIKIARFDALRASTTPNYDPERDRATLRPWLQDFDLGAYYTPEMVRAQIQATYDNGYDSWMLWDAANTYTRGALYDADFEEPDTIPIDISE